MNHYPNLNLREISSAFSDNILRAKERRESSISYIKHHLSENPLLQDNELFQVMVIGGTVFRTALCRLNKSKISVLEQKQLDQPVFDTEEVFLDFVDQHIRNQIRVLSVNFAYPLDPIFENGKLDGLLLTGSKENTFGSLVGKRVGRTLEKRAEANGNDIHVTVANDTVCLLLAGSSMADRPKLLGGIIGTGVNFALFEDHTCAVNLESANFDTFPLSSCAKAADEKTAHNGQALFEKEVSGKYLFEHFNYILRSDNLNFSHVNSTAELFEISQGTSQASQIAREIFEHSADLAACQIGGLLMYQNRDCTFIMEGSLFWDCTGYKERIEKTVVSLVPQHKAVFIKIDNSSIVGGIYLAAGNTVSDFQSTAEGAAFIE